MHQPLGMQQRHVVTFPTGTPRVEARLSPRDFGFCGADWRSAASVLPTVASDCSSTPRSQLVARLRTTKLSTLTVSDDWVTTATTDGPSVNVFRQGAALPTSFDVVQPSGGQAQPRGDIL